MAEPSLVGGRNGPIYADGDVTVEADTGVIHRTYIRLVDGNVEGSLDTSYEFDTTLKMWLPKRFVERWSGPQEELVIGEATYTNYRRFQVVSRIR